MFLVLAPILQRQKNAFKVDWHRGHLLTWIRRNASSRLRNFWIRESILERACDTESLHLNLFMLGMRDNELFREVIEDLFRAHYAVDHLRGHLANAIFDGVVFHGLGTGTHLRVGNRLVFMGKSADGSCVDMRQHRATIWDYQVSRVDTPNGGKIDILVSEERIKRFHDGVKRVLSSTAVPHLKIALLRREIRAFIEDAKYAKSALPQILEVSRWMKQKVRAISGTQREARELPELIVHAFREKSSDRFFVTTPNFFWDWRKVPEPLYLNFFNPWREI